MIRFIPEDEALPGEIISYATAVKEYQQGETASDEDINWI